MNRWESTSVKISYDDFSTICRICLGKDNLKCLQEVEYLIDLLRLLTNAEVCDDDNLPQNICDNCIQKLEEISDFLDLTKFNDSLLRQIHTTREPLTTNTISWASKNIPNGNKTVPNYTKEKTSPQHTIVAPIIENNSDYDKKVICTEPAMVNTENHEDRSTESDSSFNRDSGQDKFKEHFSMKDLLAQRQSQLIRRREGNRRAAAKRRQKLQDSTTSLAKELENLENVNSKLKNDKKKLLSEKDSLLKLLSRFKCTNKHLKILEKKANKKIST